MTCLKLQTAKRLVSLLLVGIFICVTTGIIWPQPVDAGSKQPDYVPNELIIGFHRWVSKKAKQELFLKLKIQQKDSLEFINASVVKVSGERSLKSWINLIRESPLVKYAEPNYIRSFSASANDPYYGKLWGLSNRRVQGADIDFADAMDDYSPAGTIIKVAVIDTGVDYTHPDLSRNIWINPGEDLDGNGVITSKDVNNKDDDRNGLIDDFRGWDWVNRDNNPIDDNNHGTHVSGTIAAKANNRYGVTGIAGQGYVKIISLKAFGMDGWATDSDLIKAINYARQKGAKVINASWGGGSYSQSLYNSIARFQRSGGLFVASAGNDTSNNDTTPSSPSSYKLACIVAVAASTSKDKLSYFSNYGFRNVDLAAPGSDIFSTLPGYRYGYNSGTSMAAPHVSGVAALVLTKNPSLTCTEVKTIIMNSARTVTAMQGFTVTGGVLNAKDALDITP